jgi:hypothetical protein
MSRAVYANRRSEGDAPQAAALLEGLPAEVVMAAQPTTPIICARPSLPKARLSSSPTTRHGLDWPFFQSDDTHSSLHNEIG